MIAIAIIGATMAFSGISVLFQRAELKEKDAAEILSILMGASTMFLLFGVVLFAIAALNAS